MYYSLTQKDKKINTRGEEIIYEFFALYIEKKSNLWYNELNCGGVRFSATPLPDKKQRNKMKNGRFILNYFHKIFHHFLYFTQKKKWNI